MFDNFHMCSGEIWGHLRKFITLFWKGKCKCKCTGYSLHSCYACSADCTITPLVIGPVIDANLSISDAFKPATQSMLPFGAILTDHSHASTALPGTIFLLLWFEVPDQTTSITSCCGQCVTPDKAQLPYHIVHPARVSNPRPLAQHSTEAAALTTKLHRPREGMLRQRLTAH